jgi:hypothetical protein
MSSYFTDLFCLRQDFKKIIVTQEIETTEEGTLLFKIVCQTFLHEFEVFVAILEGLFTAFNRGLLDNLRLCYNSLHNSTPFDVNTLESLALSLQLLLNIG